MAMRRRRTMFPWLPAALSVLLLATAAALEASPGEFVTIKPDAIRWQRAGEDGIEFAILAGNPNEPGIYVMRVRFPAGVMSRPHTHDQDRYVTVLEGTWHAGTQSEFDPAATIALETGSFMLHPAGAVHYDGARDTPTVVEIRGLGPVETTYVGRESATLH